MLAPVGPLAGPLVGSVFGLGSKTGFRSRLPRLLLENPLHDAGADAELPTDFQDAVTVGPQLQYSRFNRGLNPSAPQLHAVGARASKPSINPFTNDPPLELCEHAKHLKHRLARGGGGIEPLLVQEQIDLLLLQLLQDVEQIGQRSAEPIDRPCCDQVEFFGIDGL